jgi:predicted alpha/beta hydrolase family esterase
MAIRIIVAHGFNASPQRNWFPWIVEQFRPGVVTIPQLPDPTAAQVSPWVTTLTRAIGRVDDDTILIGHSLGCVTALRALESLDRPWTLGGLILVSGFTEPVPGVAKLDPFTAEPIDAQLIRDRARRRYALASDNDVEIVPAMTKRLAAEIDAELITVPGAAHFSDKTGVTAVPELLPLIRGILGQDRADTVFAVPAGS